ncbi:MAG: hypothetical protein AB202_01140 [Parcubacteria bacterium C7867-007]|nr:MAG: hypothetical protein AB202_01140 [Parcubacteria bacterium C7867-007]
MHIPPAARIGIIAVACISPFLFPSVITAILAVCAAFIFPPIAIVIGMLTDLLYEPTGYLPFASIFGLIICVSVFFVRSFLKTRIM